uniref:Acyl-CoA synthetase short-chain family member 3, mitochondrial n=1 Tax=Hirondellea gigas TaxID=1518452 RepID=A0A2P2HVP7_9CRUS
MLGTRLLLRKLTASNVSKFSACTVHLSAPANSLTVGDYETVYRNSIEKKEEFWDELAQKIVWHKPYVRVLDPNSLPTSPLWFPGGELNTCYNAVDVHVQKGRGKKVAIIHDSPVTETKKKITYDELLDQVSRLAGVLSNLGVTRGNRVLIYMPMMAEALIAMLATARLGAIHSVVFGGFAAKELSTRIMHLKPKVILSASHGIEPSRIIEYKPLLDTAIKISSHKPNHCVILQRPMFNHITMEKGRDLNWDEEMAKAKPHDAVPVESNHPCYVLYTSGTTGKPKGIVRPTGGHAVVLPWTMKAIYGMEKDDVWWGASDLGWVVGHSYICYAPLLNGNTTVIFEGKPVGTPDSKQFFRMITEHNIRGLFTAPSALRAIKQKDPTGHIGPNSNLKHLFIAGECLDHDTRVWAEKAFNIHGLDHWWQTETGYAISAHCMGLNMDPNPPRGTTGKPFIGYDLELLNSEGEKVGPGELGRIVCKLPLPPGCMNTLYDAHVRFIESYFQQYPGYYDTMDAGMKDKDGYISVLSREDDVINVSGHRMSSLALEEALMEHPDVDDALVCGVPDELKGVVPLGLVVVNKERDEKELVKELVAAIRLHVGPVAAFRHCAIVAGLPRTRSGKTPRGSIACLARGEKITISPTIEDHSVYSGIHAALQRCGFAKDVADPTLDFQE